MGEKPPASTSAAKDQLCRFFLWFGYDWFFPYFDVIVIE